VERNPEKSIFGGGKEQKSTRKKQAKKPSRHATKKSEMEGRDYAGHLLFSSLSSPKLSNQQYTHATFLIRNWRCWRVAAAVFLCCVPALPR